jgi:hypothetical protein
MILANVSLGIDACLKRCGVKCNVKYDIDEILGVE